MPTLVRALLFSVLGILAGWMFWKEVSRRLEAAKNAKGPFPTDNPDGRWRRVISEVLFQSKIIKHRPLAGIAHAFLFWAFLAFGLETINHLSMIWLPKGFLPHEGLFHTVFQGLVAIFAWAASLGIVYLAFRRFVLRPAPLGTKLSWESGLVALFILTLMQTYLIKYYGCLNPDSLAAEINWAAHTLVLFAFVVLIPRSKHLHLVLGPFSVYYRNATPGELKPLDFEAEEMGVTQLDELGQNNALALFACVECGRCLEHCPATQTGKALDPKQLVLNMRAGFLDDPSKPAVGEYVDAEWLWQCTTCGSCFEQCPVGNDQPLSILELRRGLTSEGEFPETLRTLFDNLERSGNPWRYQASDASAFIEQSGIPFHSGQKVLYWMGCMARYDEQYRKVALDFVKLMKAAGVEFGVLRGEKCTGDAARRAGNEMAFQELAMENVEQINGADPELIVSTCPHCMKTLNEYKTLGEDFRMKDIPVMHHSQFLRQLMEQGKLKLDPAKGEVPAEMVYHDACYLSRYVGDEVIDAPRELIRSGGTRLTEAERSGSRSFCCGAGGAQLFMEETAGTRINHERTKELLDTGADGICTSCPFCKTMMQDGVGDLGKGETPVLDLAQVLAARLAD